MTAPGLTPHPQPARPESRHARRRRARSLTSALTVGLLLLTACGSGDPEEASTPAAPTMNPDLPSASQLSSQDEVVPAGEWGVVKVKGSSADDVETVAVKIGAVTRGEPGQLAELTSVTGNNELLKTGAPFWISVHFADLTGDGWSNPVTSIWGFDSGAQTAAMRLSLPSSQEHCTEVSTDPGGAGKGYEQVDCAVAMFEDQSMTVDQVLYVDSTLYPEGDHAIRFAVPAS